MWAWEVLRRVVRNIDSVARNMDSVARNTDSVARNTDSVARNTDSVARNTDSVARNTDRLPDVLHGLREITDLQKAQLVMMREQSELLYELIALISRPTAVADTARIDDSIQTPAFGERQDSGVA